MTRTHGLTGTIALLLVLIGCDRDDAASAAIGVTADPAPAAIASPAEKPVERSVAADNPAGWPPIEFSPPETHFGLLGPGGTGRGSVTIWNVSDEPLRILGARTTCGCTTAERLDGRVIPARGGTTFETAMTMKSGLGDKKEKIRILFEGYGVPVDYVLRAEVTLAVRAVPPHLHAVEALAGEIVVEAQDGHPFRILATHGEPPDYVDFDPATDEPRDRYRLRWDLTELARQERVPWFWVIETDHPDCPVFDLRVRHDTTRPVRPEGRPWVPKDQRILVGTVRAGEPFEIATSIECHGKLSLPVLTTARIRSMSPQLSVEPLRKWGEDPYVKFDMKATASGFEPGLLYAELRISASGFEVPLYVIGRVE